MRVFILPAFQARLQQCYLAFSGIKRGIKNSAMTGFDYLVAHYSGRLAQKSPSMPHCTCIDYFSGMSNPN